MEQSRADRAYEVLKARIVDGAYVPGYRIVIDQLRRESDISAIPWREALRRLEAEGWVEIVPHTGARVKTFDTGTWERTVRLLARLEGLATALSVGRISPAELQEARGINDAMGEALRDFDPHRFGVLDRRFHERVCGHTEDARLDELLRAEWTRLELVRRGAFWHASGRAQRSLAEHAVLLDLLEGGADPDLVETAARSHKLNTLDAVHAAGTSAPDDVVAAVR